MATWTWESIFGYALTVFGLLFTWYQFSKKMNEERGAQRQEIIDMKEKIKDIENVKKITAEECSRLRSACPMLINSNTLERKITDLCIQLNKNEERRTKWESNMEQNYISLIRSIEKHMGKTEEFMRNAMETMNSNRREIDLIKRGVEK